MNTLEAVARILKMEGVEWVSCFPSNNLIEAVAKEGIRPTYVSAGARGNHGRRRI